MRRRQVGFIFQFYNLLPTLTAAENVALPLLLDGKKLVDYEDKVRDLMKLVGLDERMDHRPDQLSGGEQQRVAIARALVTEPAIALADEPTGNLDRKAGKQVLNLLREACKVKGQTIVMVTHDPYAASFADRVVFLRDGEMVHELQNGSNKISPQVILDVLSELEI
jgi:putative ABC transport system ATP-binding protein